MIKFKTAESVTIGHPDKLCDLIADSILDAVHSLDKDAHVACEVLITKGNIILAGEINASALPDKPTVVGEALYLAGYEPTDYKIADLMHEQSADISQAVNGAVLGAGDQGIVYGYATAETKMYLPLAALLADTLTDKLTEAFDNGTVSYLKPDGKSQVTIEYLDDEPKRITSIVISAQHEDGVPLSRIRSDILKKIIIPCIPDDLIDSQTVISINPSGRFVLGGPEADTGVTGRKLMVDTYGGDIKGNPAKSVDFVGRGGVTERADFCSNAAEGAERCLRRRGGGAFSGKDATKVDRSGAYFCRYVAKNIVASGIADECEVSASYAIGETEPTSINVDTFGTGCICDDCIANLVKELFDFRPAAIIGKLDLKNVPYVLAAHHPFGNELMPWEQTNMSDTILQEVMKSGI